MGEVNYPLSAKDREEVFKYIDTIYSMDIGGYTHD